MGLGSNTQQQQQASPRVQEAIALHHSNNFLRGQCGSMHVQHIAAPVPVAWSLVRRFDRPQSYKNFIKSCRLVAGTGGVGSVRKVQVISGLPADNSEERLDVLDEEMLVLSFSVIGGDHRLKNYRSTTTVHEGEGGRGAIVVESYVVDVPAGNTMEETCIFTDTIVRCNLKSLADVAERRGLGSLHLVGETESEMYCLV